MVVREGCGAVCTCAGRALQTIDLVLPVTVTKKKKKKKERKKIRSGH